MSLQATAGQLAALLHDEEVKVIALSGKWGTGKSHMWRGVREAATSKKVKDAAIVSLFGLSSIEQVKLKLIQSAAIQGEKNWRGRLKDSVIPGLSGRRIVADRAVRRDRRNRANQGPLHDSCGGRHSLPTGRAG